MAMPSIFPSPTTNGALLTSRTHASCSSTLPTRWRSSGGWSGPYVPAAGSSFPTTTTTCCASGPSRPVSPRSGRPTSGATTGWETTPTSAVGWSGSCTPPALSRCATTGFSSEAARGLRVPRYCAQPRTDPLRRARHHPLHGPHRRSSVRPGHRGTRGVERPAGRGILVRDVLGGGIKTGNGVNLARSGRAAPRGSAASRPLHGCIDGAAAAGIEQRLGCTARVRHPECHPK